MTSIDIKMQQSSYFQNQSELINSIEKFILNLSIEDLQDNILLIDNSLEHKDTDWIKDYTQNNQLNLSDIEENNSELLNQAMCEDNDTSYLEQIEQILDGIDNPKNLKGALTILQPKGEKIIQKKIFFEKDDQQKIKVSKENYNCLIF